MHGVGYKAICEASKAFNFQPFIPVTEQVEPDPEFPTVKFPNPEEGKSALVSIKDLKSVSNSRTTCLSLNNVNLFVPQYGQLVCPPIRATCLSPNKGNLFVPQ